MLMITEIRIERNSIFPGNKTRIYNHASSELEVWYEFKENEITVYSISIRKPGLDVLMELLNEKRLLIPKYKDGQHLVFSATEELKLLTL